jgi:hypothetical protein
VVMLCLAAHNFTACLAAASDADSTQLCWAHKNPFTEAWDSVKRETEALTCCRAKRLSYRHFGPAKLLENSSDM